MAAVDPEGGRAVTAATFAVIVDRTTGLVYDNC